MSSGIKDHFKRNARKLKNLGLTKSIAVGYRLSVRGSAILTILNLRGRND